MGQTYQTQYRVMYHDADITGHLSIPALGNYILDAAGLHAIEMGISMQYLASHDMTWVMSGIKFTIYKMPEINSTIDLLTQISDYTRLVSKRDFTVWCQGEKVADISTEWLIINYTTRRPVFLTDIFPEIEQYRSTEPGLEKYTHLRTSVKEASMRKKIRVGYSDIDINSHLYSIRYISMALDMLGRDTIGRGVRSINANFVSEILYGDEIEILGCQDGRFHNIEMRVADKMMFRAQIEILEPVSDKMADTEESA